MGDGDGDGNADGDGKVEVQGAWNVVPRASSWLVAYRSVKGVYNSTTL